MSRQLFGYLHRKLCITHHEFRCESIKINILVTNISYTIETLMRSSPLYFVSPTVNKSIVLPRWRNHDTCKQKQSWFNFCKVSFFYFELANCFSSVNRYIIACQYYYHNLEIKVIEILIYWNLYKMYVMFFKRKYLPLNKSLT